MSVDVTDVLRDRMQQPGGLQRMLTLSGSVHALLAAAVMFAPGGLLHQTKTAPTVMTISLGAGGGERAENGGMTPMGARPIQEVKPPDEPVKREAAHAPAAKAPEMTMPLPNAKATKAAPPAKTVKTAPEEARGRTPTRGAQVTAGTAIADTGVVRGQGFGLSSGGGPGSGSTLDVADFCCPDYLVTMVTSIRRAWNPNQGSTGLTIVKFTIQRSGQISNAVVEQSSGSPILDNAALRAVLTTRTLPPLPDGYPNPTLGLHLHFKYE